MTVLSTYVDAMHTYLHMYMDDFSYKNDNKLNLRNSYSIFFIYIEYSYYFVSYT